MKRIILSDGRIARISRGKSCFTTRMGKDDCTIWVENKKKWGAGYADETGKRFTIDVWIDACTGADVRQNDGGILAEIGMHNLKTWGFVD